MSKRRFAMVLMVVLSFMGLGLHVSKTEAAEAVVMTKEQLKAVLGKPEYVIIDVRTEGDWKASQWKISGAVHEKSGSTESWMGKYAKNKAYVFYCT